MVKCKVSRWCFRKVSAVNGIRKGCVKSACFFDSGLA